MGVWHRGEKGSKKVLKDPQMLTNKGVKASQACWFNSVVLSGKTKVTSSRLQLFSNFSSIQVQSSVFSIQVLYKLPKPVISLVQFSNSVKVQHQSRSPSAKTITSLFLWFSYPTTSPLKFISLTVTIVILAAVVIGIIETLRDKQEEFSNPHNLPLIPPTHQVLDEQTTG
ncbi:hypothetical protein C8J56DRAFT_1022546 [Mycena floridula]|nr:hypothetical protein C8J56DRAFT_1022546 [Mycena floridula]